MKPNRTARRAVARWAWRMFRREWRQQSLVLALLTAAVAVSIGFASAAYITTPMPDNAEFGAGSHFVKLTGTDPEGLATDVAAAREAFDDYEVIYHRPVPVPGLFEPVDFRAQSPDGPLGGPRLDLREGSYPADGEVAVTDGTAELLGVTIGATLDIDGTPRKIVGLVENPGDLSDEFVLVPPSETEGAMEATFLLDLGRRQALPSGSGSDEVPTFKPPGDSTVAVGSRPTGEGVLAAVGVLVFSTVGMLIIGLIATAGFVVVAHRRMRQLGVLAAIGATEKQLRTVTIANGAIIGALAAVAGAVVGVAGWVAVAPLVETTVGYRIDELDAPWWLVAFGMALAVLAGTAAAWLPARSVARVPPVRALSGRPPEPEPARRAVALAGVSAVVGIVCLAIGGARIDQDVLWTDAALIVIGTVAIAVAMMLACPVAVRALGRSTGRLPVAARLATSDLSRYRARSGAAVAAISLSVGIAVTVLASTGVAQAASDEGNLAEHQVLIRVAGMDGPFIPEAEKIDELQAAVDLVASEFSTTDASRLDVALNPTLEPDPSFDGREAITIAEEFEDGWRDVSLLYVATPQLAEYYGFDPDSIAPSTMLVTRETGEYTLIGASQADGSEREILTDVERIEPGYESLPGTFVPTETVVEHGWETAPSGRWLVETDEAVTIEQLNAARDLAAGNGLTIEIRDRQGGLGALRNGATAAGVVVALGIIALTVGLVRGESFRDLRILSATGATRRTRRTLTATTAGGLAVLGVVVGTGGAYLGLTAGFARDLESLTPIPLGHLAMLVIGLPVIATIAGWLVSGRDMADIGRQPIE